MPKQLCNSTFAQPAAALPQLAAAVMLGATAITCLPVIAAYLAGNAAGCLAGEA